MFSVLAKSRSFQVAVIVLPLAGIGGLFALKTIGSRNQPWTLGGASEMSGVDAIAKMRATLDADELF